MKNKTKIILISAVLCILLLCAFFGLVLSGVIGLNGKKDDFSFDDNILISIFWPPTQQYINDEQWQLMKDAEIDWILGEGDNLGTKETQMKMLDLCEKYGLHMTVADWRIGPSLLTAEPKTIKEFVKEYKNIPAARGYFIVDEPVNPNIYIDAYTTLKEADPDSDMHLNFFPYSIYGNKENCIKQMNDWCKLCASRGYPLDYLMYDLYPYGLQKGTMNRTGFLINLDAARIAGLRNNVKTANYIQSVCQCVAFRSPDRAETLYEINMDLAFGIKQISYFTWFTPVERSEPFDDGIIAPYGMPNEKYAFICELNKMTHNVGKTLINLDAKEVYESKYTFDAMALIPDDFFLSPQGDADFTVSYMRHKTTGRNFAMIVNNDFEAGKEFSVKFSGSIKSLEYVSYEDGCFYPLEMRDDGTVDLSLEAGGAIIIALPEDFDYEAGREWKPETGENIALFAEITADSSLGASDYFMDNLADGDFENGGWRSVVKAPDGKNKSVVTFEFPEAAEFNRVDIYPCVSLLEAGSCFPRTYKLSVSDNGKNWKTVYKTEVEEADFIPSLTFKPTKAVFLKIEMTYATDYAEIREIEIYNDDGSVKKPSDAVYNKQAERGTAPVTYTVGSNVALNKKVIVSSYPVGESYKSWGWWPDFLVDGKADTGWTSNVQVHMTSPDVTESCAVDLGDVFSVDKIKILPKGNWPVDFEIFISADGKLWTKVASERGSVYPNTAYEKNLPEGVTGRFVKLVFTKLTQSERDGYMVQLAELEVYGKPVVDFDEAIRFLSAYRDNGGDLTSDLYAKLSEAVSQRPAELTQSEIDANARDLLSEVGLTIEKVLKK